MIEIKISGSTKEELFEGACVLFYAFASDNQKVMSGILAEMDTQYSESIATPDYAAGGITVEGSMNSPEEYNGNTNETGVPAPITPAQQTAIPVAAPASSTVPVSEPAYDMEQLSKAAVNVAELRGRQALIDLLTQHFNVNAITELVPAQYNAFAVALRQLGATI